MKKKSMQHTMSFPLPIASDNGAFPIHNKFGSAPYSKRSRVIFWHCLRLSSRLHTICRGVLPSGGMYSFPPSDDASEQNESRRFGSAPYCKSSFVISTPSIQGRATAMCNGHKFWKKKRKTRCWYCILEFERKNSYSCVFF